MDVDQAARVREHAAIDVDAPADVVWSTLADLASWPTWLPGVRWVSATGAFEPGPAFRWKAGPSVIVSEVLVADRGREAAWRGRMLRIDAVHVWRFAGDGTRTHVETEESWSGLLPRLLPGALSRSLRGALHDGLAALQAEAEARYRRGQAP